MTDHNTAPNPIKRGGGFLLKTGLGDTKNENKARNS